jgi:hypothetical protein
MEGRYLMARTQDFRALPGHTLPERPHLDHLRSEAKNRHTALKALSHSARLSDAQLVVARSYGFSSWMALKLEVDRRRLLCGAAETALPLAAMMRPQTRERRYPRFAALGNPALAEQALFPATVAGFVLTQLTQIGTPVVALLHFLLH